jgi:chloride channel 3/4/5
MKATDIIVYRGVYSIMGASALTASVTRTVSVAVIVLELNGHMSHVVPVLIAVITSYIISELINPQGFFEMLSELNGLDEKMT